MSNFLEKPTSGGTRRVGDINESRPCNHPEHNPPRFQVFTNGRYEHTCPACGKVTPFIVNNPSY